MMDFLPNYTKPLPDETFYSWMLRLARINGLSLKKFSQLYCGRRRQCSVQPDNTYGFSDLYSHLPFTDNMKELSLSTSTMSLDMIAKPTSLQTKYFNMVLWPTDELNLNSHGCISQKVNICPECLKEDMQLYGFPYFHRSHQVQGVSVCYKHHVPLLTYSGNSHKAIDFCMDNYAVPKDAFPIGDAVAYAEYVHNLLETDLHTDLISVKEAIDSVLGIQRMDSLSIWKSFNAYSQDWEHKALMEPYDYGLLFLRPLRHSRGTPIEELLPVIMCLWPDAKDFEAVVKDHEPILSEYVCSKCGHTYLATPQSQRDGWGCPYCMKSVPIQERFDQLVRTIGQGKYETVSPFVSATKKITMWHMPCGKEFTATPTSFLFHDLRCPHCREGVYEIHGQQSVESLPDRFKLIRYDASNKKVAVYCKKCGKTFECNLEDLKSYPYRHVCIRFRKDLEYYATQVRDLVGDEYEVVRRCSDNSRKVVIRHKICGCEQTYTIEEFLKGARCRKCAKKTPYIDLLEMLDKYSCGRYEITELWGDKVTIFDAMTNQTIKMCARKLMQEINRPTPSPVLPLDPKWDSSNWVPYWDKMLSEFKDRLPMNSLYGLIYETDNLFSEWLRRQLDKWSKGDLSEERKTDLLKIAPCLDDYIPFSPLNDNKRWMKSYEIFKEYVDDHGEVRDGTRYKGHNLSSWKALQREKDSEGKLSRHRRDLLLSVDPHIFDPRKYRRKNKS